MPVNLCSTPFGIIGIFTRELCRRVGHHRNVLNAFRHHWNLHGRGGAGGWLVDLCSTPFGIIGIFTPLRRAHFHRRLAVLNAFRHHWNLHSRSSSRVHTSGSCAQRLSASLESSLATIDRTCSRLSKCSTPFGIIGIFTRRGEDRAIDLLVLNAFRHHWNLHRAEVTCLFGTLKRAQRLSASLESSPYHSPPFSTA